MSLKSQIEEDLKTAMRSQNKDEVRALRGYKVHDTFIRDRKGIRRRAINRWQS